MRLRAHCTLICYTLREIDIGEMAKNRSDEVIGPKTAKINDYFMLIPQQNIEKIVKEDKKEENVYTRSLKRKLNRSGKISSTGHSPANEEIHGEQHDNVNEVIKFFPNISDNISNISDVVYRV